MSNQILYPSYHFRKKLSLMFLKDYFLYFNNFLEIGAGRGDFSKDLMNYIKEGDVIDFSQNIVTILKKNLSGENVDVIYGNFLDYDFKKSYSLIVMLEVLEHIKEDSAALKKIYNLLRGDGIFLLSVPARMKKWDITDDIAGHYRRYEKEELIELLNKNDFKILKFASYGFPFINIITFVRNLVLKTNLKNIKRINRVKDKESLSKDSGLGAVGFLRFKKIIEIAIRILFPERLIDLFIKASSIFNDYDWGEGYLCLVKKNIE